MKIFFANQLGFLVWVAKQSKDGVISGLGLSTILPVQATVATEKNLDREYPILYCSFHYSAMAAVRRTPNGLLAMSVPCVTGCVFRSIGV